MIMVRLMYFYCGSNSSKWWDVFFQCCKDMFFFFYYCQVSVLCYNEFILYQLLFILLFGILLRYRLVGKMEIQRGGGQVYFCFFLLYNKIELVCFLYICYQEGFYFQYQNWKKCCFCCFRKQNWVLNFLDIVFFDICRYSSDLWEVGYFYFLEE